VRRNIKLAEAPSFGQTIFDYAPQCPGAGDYMQIALHQVERWWPSEAEPAPAPKARTKRSKPAVAGTPTQDAPAAGA
jgi:chromosome partitioning protein